MIPWAPSASSAFALLEMVRANPLHSGIHLTEVDRELLRVVLRHYPENSASPLIPDSFESRWSLEGLR